MGVSPKRAGAKRIPANAPVPDPCLHMAAGIRVTPAGPGVRPTVDLYCPECGRVAELTEKNAGAVLALIGDRHEC